MEEHRLEVFENRVLRRIFGQKKEEVTGGWRKLRNKKCCKTFEVLTAVKIWIMVFWVVTLYILKATFSPEDAGVMFRRNTGNHLTASQPTRPR
jgi:hypothetical protein